MTRQTGFPVITAEALAELRRRIGIPVRRPEPYIETATRDAVRHWMAGIGDRNPFWLDAGVVPPTILFAMDRIVSGYVGGLPGIHAMYGGTDFRWQRPIRIGEAIVGDSVLLDLVEKPSQFARRAIQQIYRTTFRNQTRDIVCEADSWCFRTERDTARERGKYSAVEPPRYTAREIDAIATAYRAEEARGRAPRYWDDVTVGDALPDVVKRAADGDVRHRIRAGVGKPLRAGPRTCLRECSSVIPRSAFRTPPASPSRRSACTGTTRWRRPSGYPAPTTTAPSVSPGSGTWSPTGWATRDSCADSTRGCSGTT